MHYALCREKQSMELSNFTKMSFTKYISNVDHYEEVLSRASKVKESLFIGIASSAEDGNFVEIQ
jgi:hypothetical protein